MTFETYFKEKNKEIEVLKKQIDVIMRDIQKEAVKAYRAEGEEAFKNTSTYPSDMQYMGVASVSLDYWGDTAMYLFLGEMEDAPHDGWVPSSSMN